MKFSFVIAALFVASAMAAPCARRHVDDVADMSPMDNSNDVADMPMDDNNNDITPMDDNSNDTSSTNDNTPTTDDSLATSPPPTSAGFESSPDTKDQVKTSDPSGGQSDNSQTAVINNDSPSKGGHGSLFGLDTSSLLAGGVLGGTDNAVHQSH